MKIERNALCPCGSGKKYKKCHGAPAVGGAATDDPPAVPPIADPQRVFNEALTCHRAGMFQEAGQLYGRLLQAHPDNADLLHNLGLIRFQMGQWSESIELIRRAIHVAPTARHFHASLGTVLVAAGEYPSALEAFQRADSSASSADPQLLANHAVALGKTGRLGQAIAACEASLRARPTHVETLNTLGNLLNDSRRYEEAAARYLQALHLRSDSPKVRSNYLMMLNYSGLSGPEALLEAHRQYGEAHARVWEALPAHHRNSLDRTRKLRLAYLSPDFGQHPIGYFLRDVIARHDRSAFDVVLYSTHQHRDPMAEAFRAHADLWRDCQGLSDAELFSCIKEDRIDIVVDLAGHTAGNRLPILAQRPAPIQLTYLGYTTTTGMQSVGFRLTDAIVDPPGSDAGTEEPIRLRDGMFRYSPPADAPEVSPAPILRSGAATFGCYCNLSKATPRTIALWARVLSAVPGSRLIIKANALGDDDVRNAVVQEFEAVGVPASRLEFLGWTGYAQHLADYARVDVVLDTVPFNLATNTCEALWMGVPVVTLADAQPAGRIGASLLSGAGLEHWIARSEDEYVSIAAGLVRDAKGLVEHRRTLRARLLRSALFDAPGLAAELDAVYRALWERWVDRAQGNGRSEPTEPRTVLHVGCGSPEAGVLPAYFRGEEWRELRLDIDPAVRPDYVASTTDMRVVPDGTADALYSSHNVEHLYADEVPKALGEFFRVLSDDGFALIVVPDLKAAAECVIRDEHETTLYDSPAGPISAMDMIFGYGPFIRAGNAFMAHKTGFTAVSLERAVYRAGFARAIVQSQGFSLWALAFKR